MDACALLALLAVAAAAPARPHTNRHHKQDPNSIWVDILDVAPISEDATEEVEKRYSEELAREVEGARGEALLLYTEYQARAATDMKTFVSNITSLNHDALVTYLQPGELDQAPSQCRSELRAGVSRAVWNAQRGAAFSAHNHHKFFLGHMIVFRMHLNKSEEYLKKCERVIEVCGHKCETSPKVTRWRQMALSELSRVRGDVQHARAQYRDLLTHAHRRLRTLRTRALRAAKQAAEHFRECCTHFVSPDT